MKVKQLQKENKARTFDASGIPVAQSAGRQIGNAVPPPLAEAIGLAIKLQL